ncbi:hypothetical protein [Vibrio breoganii]|nr:hypothetical protein [Vibrio breoganii]
MRSLFAPKILNQVQDDAIAMHRTSNRRTGSYAVVIQCAGPAVS